MKIVTFHLWLDVRKMPAVNSITNNAILIDQDYWFYILLDCLLEAEAVLEYETSLFDVWPLCRCNRTNWVLVDWFFIEIVSKELRITLTIEMLSWSHLLLSDAWEKIEECSALALEITIASIFPFSFALFVFLIRKSRLNKRERMHYPFSYRFRRL